MSTVNLSARFENNLRKTSEVGVAVVPGVLDVGSDRLSSTPEYAVAADTYTVYTIPKDSIVSKFYFIVDEAFDAATTAEITTIAGTPTELVAALDCATEGASVSAVVDQYFDATDGFSVTFSQDVTKGKLRIAAEFISLSTNDGTYVDLGA